MPLGTFSGFGGSGMLPGPLSRTAPRSAARFIASWKSASSTIEPSL